MRSVFSTILLAAALAACGSGKTPPAQPAPTGGGETAETPPAGGEATPPAETPPAGPSKPVTNSTLTAIGLDPAALDRTADPCEDFFQFACGTWVKNTQIAADKPIAMRSFVDIQDKNYEYEHEMLEKAKKDPGKDPLLKKLGTYYGACMDEAAIEKAGLKPIQPALAQIAKVKDAKSLTQTITWLQTQGLNPLFTFGPTEDFADATKVIAGIDQGGLGLPDRDYYLKDDDKTKALRAAYQEFAAALLVEAGHKPDAAKQEAADIVALQTEIAKSHKDRVAMRDPKGVYNKIDRDGVAKAMSHFDWNVFWKGVGLANTKDVTVSAPEFLTGLDALIVKTKPELWRNYLTVSVISNTAPLLTKKLQDLNFKLEQAFTGQAEQKPRWKRCIDSIDGVLPDELGQVFVRDRFPGASKTAAEDQIKAISAAMSTNIDSLPWMDATTKQKAHVKLAAMAYQIGYPKTWRSHTFKIGANTFGLNALAGLKAETARQLAKIGKPTDREDWQISAPTVNAFYSPTHNKMVFPAGILQPPFYAVDHSVTANLGGMGMVVGHELTHGFDDQGSQFDEVGNMKDWWQPETAKQFKQRTQCVVDQYSKYEIAGVKLNGSLTQGENIADIGGIKLALAAYRSLRASAPDTIVADGFTEDQQFFLAFGQAWCAKSRPEYEQMLATLDPHSPPIWRVNGTVAATPDFAKAFSCKLGAKLRPKNACVVW